MSLEDMSKCVHPPRIYRGDLVMVWHFKWRHTAKSIIFK
uniref:Uncharacterized protein n=1 Tax=Anguilla anguilla TaxID=7936 RepID=A0A0E9PC88_ANGAN